jgi:hypothetical protein
MNYQYLVFNDHINFIVTTISDDEFYAKNLGKRVAMDYFDFTEEQTKDLNCKLITQYQRESVVNLQLLTKE